MDKQRPGPKPGSANEAQSTLWWGLLGDLAEEVVEEAHRDAAKIKSMDAKERRKCFKENYYSTYRLTGRTPVL